MSEINLNKPITLVGIMGCGKSYIGKSLAADLGVEFYDSDSLIEVEQGKTINQIFADDGEAHFRLLEKDMITGLLDKGFCVIATGGGCVTTPEVLQNIKNNSISIWLQSDVDTIYKRIKWDKTRPLLQCDDSKEKLAEILDNREELYRQAGIHIDNSLSEISNLTDNIILEIRKFNAD